MKKKKMGKGLGALLDIYNGYDNDDAADADNIEVPDVQLNDAPDRPESGLTTLRTSEIEPDRKQPRTDFNEEAIEELAQSVSQHGILQPILVRPSGEGYKIVAGERRWRAAMRAGLREIPVIIREMTELEATQIALIENLQRESLNPIEEALGYKRLTEEFSMTQEQIAKQVSKSRSVIANSLRLLNLPENVRKMLSDGDISVGHAKVLAGVEDKQFASALAEKVKSEKISVRELEREVAKGHERAEEAGKKIGRIIDSFVVDDPYLRELELSMSRVTQGKVKVAQQKNGKLRVDMEFKDMDELKQFAASIAGIAETE